MVAIVWNHKSGINDKGAVGGFSVNAKLIWKKLSSDIKRVVFLASTFILLIYGYIEKKQALKECLKKVSSVATTADLWSCRNRYKPMNSCLIVSF